jgi:hypothetical protein
LYREVDERCRRGEHLGRFEATHPIFAVFSGRATALGEACFWKIALLGPRARAENDRRVLAWFDGGAPALVEARLGAGRLLLYASTLDRDWNDLAIHPGYLPLWQQAVRYLARAPMRESAQDGAVGRAQPVEVAADDRRIEVTAPSGPTTTFEGERLEGRTRVLYSGTEEPGFYRVMSVGADGSERRRPGGDFVVNLDPRGSDTRRVSASSLPGRGAAAGGTAAAETRRRVELWHALAAALLLFLLAEALLVRRAG